MSEQVFVVGKYIHEHSSGAVWELQGVFSSAENADEACTSTHHFYGPVVLDKRLPEETVDWPGCIYPRCGN